jgi:REP element-mobilizing transposase RayT/DNA-binding NarL/FixJ family response regulator
MMHPVLVVSVTTGFTELIQITLQDDGRYDPFCVTSAEMGLAAAKNNRFAVAILDSDVTDLPVVEVAQALRLLNPDIRIVAIPPQNDLNHPSLADLKPDGCLTKPFYLPELVRLFDRLLKPIEESAVPPQTSLETDVSAEAGVSDQTSVPTSQPTSEPVPDWLQDVNRTAQHLTRLSLESAAHAALVVRDGKLWAYAGDLQQDAAQELAQQVGRYWKGPHQGQSDLARFIHLESTDSDYMLYATGLSGNMALALAFNAATPFTKMRAQAAELARALADGLSKPSPAVSSHGLASHPQALVIPPPPTSPASEIPPVGLPEAGLSQLPSDDEEIPLLDLGEVPPPIPRRAKKQPTQTPATPSGGERTGEKVNSRSSSSVYQLSPFFELDSLPEAMPPDVAPPLAQPTTATEWIPAPATEPPPVPTPPSHLATSAAAPGAAAKRNLDTRPLRFEPPSPTVCSLSFACVLVPRLPQHHLVGDIADQLPNLMQQICLAFGWRLEHLAVRPDYVQWLVSVPPSTSASYLMRILRHQLSERLFEKFPTLAVENPSGDFWAPGYLIMSSHQLPPPNIVSDFVTNTRRYQGLNQTLENVR